MYDMLCQPTAAAAILPNITALYAIWMHTSDARWLVKNQSDGFLLLLLLATNRNSTRNGQSPYGKYQKCAQTRPIPIPVGARYIRRPFSSVHRFRLFYFFPIHFSQESVHFRS